MSAPARTVEPSLFKSMARGALIAFTILSFAVILAAVVVPRVINAVPLTVLSGSMQPVFKPGALIVSQRVSPLDIHVGDIATYQVEPNDPMLITHRVKAIAYGVHGIDHFTFRGDANGVDDAPVKPGQVMGRYVYQIPYLGYLAHAIPVSAKPFIAQGIGGVLIVWAAIQFVVARLRKHRQSREAIHAPNPQEEDADVAP